MSGSQKRSKDLVVTLADKRGGIVVLDKSAYPKEINNILSDRDTYIPPNTNPVDVYKKELEKIVNRGFLVPLAPCTRIMYYLPKIHKNPVCSPG